MIELSHKIPLLLDGFEVLKENVEGETVEVDPGSIRQLNFEPTEAQDWYEQFCQRIFDALGNDYLPVYRMADGEFKFIREYLNEKRPPYLKKVLKNTRFWLTPKHKYNRKLKSATSDIVKRLFDQRLFWVAHAEYYTSKEHAALSAAFPRDLELIVNKGILSCHFVLETGNESYARFHQDVLDYFEAHRIQLRPTNYFPFYFVYALLSTDRSKDLFHGRNVLIITHATEDKKASLGRYFKTQEVSGLEFYDISANKSFFDIIDLNSLQQKPDIVLVGAGIGAVNVLAQLEPLQVPCIDAGYMLEVYANEDLRGGRIYVQ